MWKRLYNAGGLEDDIDDAYFQKYGERLNDVALGYDPHANDDENEGEAEGDEGDEGDEVDDNQVKVLV